MRIAIAGGTGTLGRRVVEQLQARGHEVRVLSRNSRHYPVDLTTGAGLVPALDGCEVVVDATNNSGRRAAGTLVDGSRRLLDAGRTAGVGHHVCVSVVGCERVPMGYFAVKARQERVVADGPVPWTIVRATQFHEYVTAPLDSARGLGVLPAPGAPLQPVAADEVAVVVADVAEKPALRARVEVAGPEVLDMRRILRAWRQASGRRAIFVPVPLPGAAGRALREGALVNRSPDVRGGIRYAAWLPARKR